MAGIGVKLNRIYSKKTMLTSLVGIGYSAIITVVPMFLVILAVMLMEPLLGVSKLSYATRELYSCTVLYIFIFGLLTSAPFSAVLSRYLSDVIYEETYQDILPCYYVGLILNIVFSALIGIPFCVWEYVVGGVDLGFVFAGYCGYAALVIVFYSMMYLSICKSFAKIAWFFMVGMVSTILSSLLFVYTLKMDITLSMLVAIDAGFVLIASLELAQIKSYFRYNSKKYKEVLGYFKKYWQLVITNFLYMSGIYIHNFVFWLSDLRMVVSDSFVCVPVYDMATCLGMLTNVSASIIFISRVEMRFNRVYKGYSEAVIGGRGMDIDSAKKRMFRQLSSELVHLARDQFAISILVFFLFITFLPRFGFGGLSLQIYPCLAVGYYIWFLMNAAIIFQYYYSDLNGALMSSVSFCIATLLTSFMVMRLSPTWYGLGLVVGALVGWTVAYFRLRFIEKSLDVHIFCNGTIMKKGRGECLDNKVFDRYAQLEESRRNKKKKKKVKYS